MPQRSIVVGGDSSYKTIQQGIDAAEQAGIHNIVVLAGTYTESDTLSAADNGLSITAASAGVTLAGSLTINDASSVTISGLTFQGDGDSTAIDAVNSTKLTITDNTLTGAGVGIAIDGTTDSTVSANQITNTTRSAIEEFHGANNDTIDGNIINGATPEGTIGAIWVLGADGGSIAHNDISNTTGPAISLSNFINTDPAYPPDVTVNTGILIADNRLDNVATTNNDSGAIYVLGRSQVPDTGIVIQSNYIGAVGPATAIPNPHFVGIYLDDNASGVTVTHNILQASAGLTDPFEIHGGSNNTISGNIFDLGTGSPDFGLLQKDESGLPPIAPFQELTNDVVSGNIFVTESTTPFIGYGNGSGGFANLTAGAANPISISITGNDYWSYGGAPLNVAGTGPTGDANPRYNPPAGQPAQSLADYATWSGAGIGFAATNTTAIGAVQPDPVDNACYCRGTHIATAGGEVLVENLVAGDQVLTATGVLRPIVWIGRRRLDLHAHPKAAPIVIAVEALGPHKPHRELRVSPDHGMALDGHIVPARLLVNGVTIRRAPACDAVEYFHVELASHDIILAEGAEAESWLDTGNREMFENAPVARIRSGLAREHVAAGAAERAWNQRACAPLLQRGGARLDAIRTRLAEHSGLPRDLVLQLDALGRHCVSVPPGTTAVMLASTVGGAPDDCRDLGAGITDVMLDGVRLELDHPAFDMGFHPVESDAGGAWRWTDGRGRLEIDAADRSRLLEINVVALPDLVITLDAPGRHRVTVPAGVSAVMLASALGGAIHESRHLGAAIINVTVDGVRLALDHPAFAAGFHTVETNADGAWRWTDGRARLEIGAADRPRLLEIQVAAFADVLLTLDAAGRHRVTVPAGVPAVILASAVRDALNDFRHLGAAITGVTLDGVRLTLDQPAFAAGFHAVEINAAGAWRWTNGRARLEIGAADRPRTLEIHVAALPDLMPALQSPGPHRTAPAGMLSAAGTGADYSRRISHPAAPAAAARRSRAGAHHLTPSAMTAQSR